MSLKRVCERVKETHGVLGFRFGEAKADLMLYTEGSPLEGRCGGEAVVVTRDDPEYPMRVTMRSSAAGAVTSSYQAEVCVG